MAWLIDLLSGLALLGGVFFVIVGGIGLLRMPDLYTRMHVVGRPRQFRPGCIRR